MVSEILKISATLRGKRRLEAKMRAIQAQNQRIFRSSQKTRFLENKLPKGNFYCQGCRRTEFIIPGTEIERAKRKRCVPCVELLSM